MKKLLAFLLLVSVLVCNFLSCNEGENVETDGASSKDNAVTLNNTEGPTENPTEKPTERENEENDNTVFQILREYDTQIDADAFVEQLIAKEGNTAAELENYIYYSELEFVWAKLISLNKKAMLTVEVFANDEDAKLYYEENMSESVMPIFDDSFISFVRIGKVCMTFQQLNGKNIIHQDLHGKLMSCLVDPCFRKGAVEGAVRIADGQDLYAQTRIVKTKCQI